MNRSGTTGKLTYARNMTFCSLIEKWLNPIFKMNLSDSFSTDRPLYHYYPPDTPLGTNFNTKLASGFLHHWLCGYAEIKSAKVGKGPKSAIYEGGGFILINRTFYRCPQESLCKNEFRSFSSG